eukprot:TRINITY_DN13983_c0_g1_i1.p1 TRINITY_DN13983_c0_g1~~TRINITY_DN13983_c0_g1_i1.p1  ORF type:complete len:255 (+),score=51.96 TRINITY_DN13983_c0_g1_i1:61-825(+)
MSEEVRFDLGRLPVELQDVVVGLVDELDVVNAMLVCRRWHTILRQPQAPSRLFWITCNKREHQWQARQWKDAIAKERQLQQAALETIPDFLRKHLWIKDYFGEKASSQPVHIRFVLLRIISSIITSGRLDILKQMLEYLLPIYQDTFRQQHHLDDGAAGWMEYMFIHCEHYDDPRHLLLRNICLLQRNMNAITSTFAKLQAANDNNNNMKNKNKDNEEIGNWRKNMWNDEWNDALPLANPWLHPVDLSSLPFRV